MTNRLRSKARRSTLALALAGATLAAPFSVRAVGAAEQTTPATNVTFTVDVPPIATTTPVSLTVEIDDQKTTVGGDNVEVIGGGELTLNLATTTGTINVTRDETAQCPTGETGAVILVTGAITNVTGTATFTPTGDFADLGVRTVAFEVPNQARQAKATICAMAS